MSAVVREKSFKKINIKPKRREGENFSKPIYKWCHFLPSFPKPNVIESLSSKKKNYNSCLLSP